MFLRKEDFDRALKLAERTIQYADTLSLLADGHLRAGRAAHLEGGRPDEAARHYELANKSIPSVWASVGLAGAHIQKGK
jgi:RNA polymerase-associated protein CTR9